MTSFRRRISQILGTSVVLASCGPEGREERMRRDLEDSVCFAGGVPFPTDDTDAAIEPLLPIDTPNEASYVVQLNGYRVPCDDDNNFRRSGDRYYIYAETGTTCDGKLYGHILRVDADGSYTVEKTKVVAVDRSGCAVPGRSPLGLVCDDGLAALCPETRPGDWLAEAAYFEAAAVAAFEHLAVDLQRCKAPDRLVSWATRSALQEKNHALACRKLARGYKARAPQVRLRRPSPRSLFELACENTREGLTNEAFSALLAKRQALHARDTNVRKVMQSIADDEISHAEFSIELHRWLKTRLSRSEKARVDEIRARALFELQRDGLRDYSPLVQERLGLPSKSESRRLCRELFN